MSTRLKYLVFLGFFLTGSFLIITWKSFDIFSKKYAQTYQNMQVQDLEKQAVIVQSQFDNLQKILSAQTDVEPMLKAQEISLLAHIIKENGKWKAQWFEGIAGLRSQAKSIAQQIPFDALSTSKKTWHLVNVKGQGAHLAYVVPVYQSGKVSYYSFFFKTDFFSKWFRGASTAENLTLMAPQLGEVFAFGDKPIDGIEKHRSLLAQKQTGLWPTSKTSALVTYFHPDLQLLFVKHIQLQNMVVESASYLRALMVIICLLVIISMVVTDLVFRGFFSRMDMLEEQGQKTNMLEEQSLQTPMATRMPKDRQEDSTATFSGESKVRPAAAFESVPVTSPAALTSSAQINFDVPGVRTKAINCLGYLNRYKSQNPAAASQLLMLEKELRELRAIIDPIEKTPTAQVASRSTKLEPISSDFDVQSLLTSIRKPKREKHESQKV